VVERGPGHRRDALHRRILRAGAHLVQDKTCPINTLIRVRQGGVIVPFETTSSITSTGMSVGAVRTPDTIAT